MSSNETQLIEDSIFKIGRVVSVDGRTVRIKVDKSKNTSHLLYKGELLKNVSVGGYIKIVRGFTKIVAKVEGEFTTEDLLIAKKDYGSEKDKINRILAVSLLGFFDERKFERGIKELPLVGNECYLLHNKEFNEVHDFIRDNDDPLPVGRLSFEKGQEIGVGVNSLFASHIGIFGNTGSGKSYTLAKLYRELFKLYKTSARFQESAAFFLIDFNGEYVGDSPEDGGDIIVGSSYKRLYRLSTRANGRADKFPMTREALNDSSFWVVFLEATEKTQAPFLQRALEGGFSKRIFESGVSNQDPNSSVRQVIYSFVEEIILKKDKNLGVKVLSELLADLRFSVSDRQQLEELEEFSNKGLHYNGTTESYYFLEGSEKYYKDSEMASHFFAPFKELLDKVDFLHSEIALIRLKIMLKYHDEIIKGYSNKDHISPLLKRLDTRLRDLEKVVEIADPAKDRKGANFTIVSLKDVNIHIRKILPLLLCKNLYDEKKKSNDGKTYLNIIIDEAHNILSEASERESEQWRDYRLETFEEIIKEGRKFGTFLTIASQRPADISPTILSQLHNYFLHRLINNNDIYAVEKTIAYLDKVSFEYLPILPTGTCILAGLLAQVPVVVDIGKIPDGLGPRSKTMTLTEKWK